MNDNSPLTCSGLGVQDPVGEAEAPEGQVAVQVVRGEVDPHVAAVQADGVQARPVAREGREGSSEQLPPCAAQRTHGEDD